MKFVKVLTDIKITIHRKDGSSTNLSTSLINDESISEIELKNISVDLYHFKLHLIDEKFCFRFDDVIVSYDLDIPKEFLSKMEVFLIEPIYDLSSKDLDSDFFISKKNTPIIRVIFEGSAEEILMLRLSL